MERIKRQQIDIINDSNINKKAKLENEIIIINTNKSLFENLADEILYKIFDYLDIYQGFFNLNNRFQNLLLHSNLSIQINISTISKLNFKHYHKDIILPNKHRINFLRLSNLFTVDIIFSPPRLISKFVQLETLILDNISTKYLHNILRQAILLPKLYSFVLTLVDHIADPNNQNLPLIFLEEYKRSSIEYLIINSRFRYDSLDNLFLCLPKLRYLFINCLIKSSYIDIYPFHIPLKYLKYVSLTLDGIYFDRLAKIN